MTRPSLRPQTNKMSQRWRKLWRRVQRRHLYLQVSRLHASNNMGLNLIVLVSVFPRCSPTDIMLLFSLDSYDCCEQSASWTTRKIHTPLIPYTNYVTRNHSSLYQEQTFQWTFCCYVSSRLCVWFASRRWRRLGSSRLERLTFRMPKHGFRLVSCLSASSTQAQRVWWVLSMVVRDGWITITLNSNFWVYQCIRSLRTWQLYSL